MSDGADGNAMAGERQSADDAGRPPLGLRPRYIAERLFREERRAEVQAAISRYQVAGVEVPYEWHRELGDLNIAAYRDEVADAIESVMRAQRNKRFRPRPA